MTLRSVNVFGLPWWLRSKESAGQCRRQGLDPWSRKIPDNSEQLSPCATTAEPLLWSLGTWTIEAHAPQQEKPQQWEAWAPKIEGRPHSPQLEKNRCNNKGPAQPKVKQINFFFLKKSSECFQNLTAGAQDSCHGFILTSEVTSSAFLISYIPPIKTRYQIKAGDDSSQTLCFSLVYPHRSKCTFPLMLSQEEEIQLLFKVNPSTCVLDPIPSCLCLALFYQLFLSLYL